MAASLPRGLLLSAGWAASNDGLLSLVRDEGLRPLSETAANQRKHEPCLMQVCKPGSSSPASILICPKKAQE